MVNNVKLSEEEKTLSKPRDCHTTSPRRNHLNAVSNIAWKELVHIEREKINHWNLRENGCEFGEGGWIYQSFHECGTAPPPPSPLSLRL